MKSLDNSKAFIKSLFKSSLLKNAVKQEGIKEINRMSGDASSRIYYRLKTDSQSYVVCLDGSFSDESYPFLEVHKFLTQAKINVPLIHDFDSKKGYLLEEDLGDDTLLKYSSNFTVTQELEVYKKCVDLLIKFQCCPLGKNNYSFQQLRFDSQKLYSEVDFTINHFFNFLLGEKVKKWEGEIENVRKELKKVSDIIAEKSMVFTHRDYHSRNIMVKNGEFVIIDFQDARWGLPQYDLVSLLDDCYYELDSVNKENVKKYYFSQLSSIVDDQNSYCDFSYFYDLMCIQRVFKAIGTFVFIFNSRSDERYLKYIAFAFEKLKKILWKHQEFYRLRKSLAMIYYEN